MDFVFFELIVTRALGTCSTKYTPSEFLCQLWFLRVNLDCSKTGARVKPGIHDTSFASQVSIQENLDQENLNSSLCIHDARNFDEYTQVLAGDTTNKMAFLGGEEGASLCIALSCTIVLRRRLSSKKRSTWARKWLRRRRWDVFL